MKTLSLRKRNLRQRTDDTPKTKLKKAPSMPANKTQKNKQKNKQTNTRKNN